MNDTVKMLIAGSFTAIFLGLVLSHGRDTVNLVNAGFTGASGYAKTLQMR